MKIDLTNGFTHDAQEFTKSLMKMYPNPIFANKCAIGIDCSYDCNDLKMHPELENAIDEANAYLSEYLGTCYSLSKQYLCDKVVNKVKNLAEKLGVVEAVGKSSQSYWSM